MDPTACLRRIVEASRRDKTEYMEACEALASWLDAGGFKPDLKAAGLTKRIPGAGTQWAVWDPAPGTERWELVHYDHRGTRLASWELEESIMIEKLTPERILTLK